jgi:hypothetical protein
MNADSVTQGKVTMTLSDDGVTWLCSAGCPFVFERDQFGDDVAYHLEWHAQNGRLEGR